MSITPIMNVLNTNNNYQKLKEIDNLSTFNDNHFNLVEKWSKTIIKNGNEKLLKKDFLSALFIEQGIVKINFNRLNIEESNDEILYFFKSKYFLQNINYLLEMCYEVLINEWY